jgi:hypothetical protein
MAWRDQLKSLSDIISAVKPDPSWPAVKSLAGRLHDIEKSLESDLSALEEYAGFIFSSGNAAMTVDLFRRWHTEGRAPSLVALSIFALRNLGIHDDDPQVLPILMAGLLGEAPNTLAYHNNMHYRKVLFQTTGMIAAHNTIFDSTPRALDKDRIALLVAGACVHDLGHDGKANNGNGNYVRGRAEKQSFLLARPYLSAAGLQESELDDLFVMFLCTDVTPLEKKSNPASEMKAAYRFHELGGEGKGLEPELSPDVEILRKRVDLALSSMILHEADIATSAGLDYDLTCYETALIRDEMSDGEARPSHIIEFLDRICQRQMHTDAGKKLYGDNLEKIYAQALLAVQNGDKPLPRPENSPFIRGERSPPLAANEIN